MSSSTNHAFGIICSVPPNVPLILSWLVMALLRFTFISQAPLSLTFSILTAFPSGLLVVPLADNLNYPEPLRVWPSNANPPAGDVMWNFSPTKEQPFTLRPGAELTLAYRVYVLEERLDADAAARLAGLSGERTDGKH